MPAATRGRVTLLLGGLCLHSWVHTMLVMVLTSGLEREEALNLGWLAFATWIVGGVALGYISIRSGGRRPAALRALAVITASAMVLISFGLLHRFGDSRTRTDPTVYLGDHVEVLELTAAQGNGGGAVVRREDVPSGPAQVELLAPEYRRTARADEFVVWFSADGERCNFAAEFERTDTVTLVFRCPAP